MVFKSPSEIKFIQTESPLYDAFGRFRVSNPQTIFDSNFLTINQHDKWTEGISGTAFSGYTSGFAWVTLNTPALNNQRIVRQTRTYAIYQPGKSFLAFFTGTLADKSGVSSRIGVYDDNDGFYYQLKDGELSVVKRTSISGSVVETKVVQSNWNKNKLDGSTGAGGLTIDPTKRQIFFLEQEWLGVGTLRTGVVLQNRQIVYTHQFDHANQDDVVPYTNRASLPIRYELVTDPTGTVEAATMYQICTSVQSEGGVTPRGNIFSYSQDNTTGLVSSETALILFRVNTDRARVSVNPLNINVILSTYPDPTTLTHFLIRVYRLIAPVTTSDYFTSGTLTWNNTQNLESAIEYSDNLRTEFRGQNNILSGARFVLAFTFYVSSTQNKKVSPLDNLLLTGSDIEGNTDYLLITGEELAGQAVDELSVSMIWQELE